MPKREGVTDIVDCIIAKSFNPAFMLADAPPCKANRMKFLESDRLTTLDLPQDGNLVARDGVRDVGAS